MNNALLTEEQEVADIAPDLTEREGELVKLIELLRKIDRSSEWRTLKEELFDGALKSLESRLASESKKSELNLPEIYRLQGQIRWANRYADLGKLAEVLRLELKGIQKQL